MESEKIKELQKLADQGNVEAQNKLGDIYYHGEGVELDYEKAFYWHSKAAEQGNAFSQNDLGYLYNNGEGVAQDYDKALYWYTKAAEQGDGRAQNNLGSMYAKGEGVEQDYDKAFYWYKKAIEQDDELAQNNLGFMYYDGDGVEQNYERAIYWFTKAAEQGYAPAQHNLGVMYDNGEGTKQDSEVGIYWYLKAAEQNFVHAQFNLGCKYEQGDGVDQDLKKAVYWYEKAVKQGDSGAQYNLGRIYYYEFYSKVIKKDYYKARKLFEQAAEQGHVRATFALAQMYENGDGCEKDNKKAFSLYLRAADYGNEMAKFKLGLFYYCGKSIEQNKLIALNYWQEAAIQKEPCSQFFLSLMYKNGDIVEKDEKKARELWIDAKNELTNDVISSFTEYYYKYREVNNENDEAYNNSMLEENTNSDNLYCIKGVDIVSGKALCSYWKSNMQLISTDKGDFIDNLPGISHGSTPPGHDWKKEIGKKVDVVISKDSKSDNTWIFIKQEYEKYNNYSSVSPKEELPLNYDINENPELVKTYEYIKQNVPVIFLTGGAGTGKSTFIKFIKNNLKNDMYKNYIVLAPTGVAAINVGGQTIHSFFRWNSDVFEDEEVTIGKYINPAIHHTDLIIIDEISMVHSWMIDHIDYALRLWCDKTKPFGGKQLLLIGDCFQLPPVINSDDEEKKEYYARWESPFFFASKALGQFSKEEIKAIQLSKIYRQENDEQFIHILNRIRRCRDGYEKDIAYLNKTCFIETRLGTTNIPEECLLLCSTNSKADDYNNRKLFNLEKKGNKPISYKAIITGDFHYDNKSFLTKDSLDLCIGAKIMVTKNISSLGLVNGDMGIVLGFGGTGKSSDDYVDINVKGKRYHITRETWQKIEYTWNEKTKTINQQEVGSFNQIPLRLGWAVTIHKSQGLTLDSVAIDAPEAWDSGQIYVALSRAKTLNGILLCQKIPVSAIKIDNYVQKKYEELFPENNENNIANIEEDYNACLSNEGFTIDKSEEQTSVMIEGISFELYPKDGGKIGQFAQHTIANLLIHNLIPEQEMQRLLNDQNYCYNTFGICYNFPTWTLRLPLLTKNRINNENRVRYWATAYNGYYVCSQWYPDCKSKLAKWLMNLSKGNLSGYVTAEDDSYNDESVNWAKIKQEEKEKNFAAYFKQQREMEEERKKREEYEQMFSSRKVSPPINIIPQETKKNNSTKNTIIKETPIKKSSNSIKKENQKDLPIIVKRNDSFNSTYYQLDSIDGTKTYFARKDGMGNPMPPEFNTKIELVIRKSEDGKIIKWEWDGIR